MNYISPLITLLVCGICLMNTVSASTNDSSTSNDWSYSIAPYLWVTGQKGTVATIPPGQPIDIDVSFNDVISNLDMP